MKLASRSSSYSKLKTHTTLETCDEEPSCFDDDPSCFDNDQNVLGTNSTTDTNNNNNKQHYRPNRRIMRNKTKSHENYGSIEKVSKSFEDKVLSR